MVYKLNKDDEIYTPLWVKVLGGMIAAGIGAAIGLVLAYNMIVWYISSCEYNADCAVYQLMQKL